MRKKHRVLSCAAALTIGAILSTPAPSMAALRVQNPPSKAGGDSQQNDEAAKAKLEQKAMKLLDQAMADAAALTIPENRIQLTTTIANVLWLKNEPRARELFKRAADDVVLLAAELGSPDSGVEPQDVFNVRNYLIQTLVTREPELALDLLERTGQAASPGQDTYLELSIAQQLAGHDPKKALELAEHNLASGLGYGEVQIAQELHSSDPASSQKLASEILSAVTAGLAGADSNAMWTGIQLAQAALQSSAAGSGQLAAPPGDGGQTDQTAANQGINNALLQSADLKGLLTALVSSASNEIAIEQPGYGNWYNCRNVLNQIRTSVLPSLSALDSGFVSGLQTQVNAAIQSADQKINAVNPAWAAQQSGSPAAMFQAAGSAPANMRDSLYSQAAWQYLNSGDSDKAFQAADRISNQAIRQQMRDQLEQGVASRAIMQGDADAGLEKIDHVASKDARAQLMINLANMLIAKENKKGAALVVSQCQALLGPKPVNYQELALMESLASLVEKVEPEQTPMVLGSISDQFNAMIPAAEALSGFDVNLKCRNGEMSLVPTNSLVNYLQQFGNTLGTIAVGDFDRAVAASDQIAAPEARLLTRVSIIQLVLNDLGTKDYQTRSGANSAAQTFSLHPPE